MLASFGVTGQPTRLPGGQHTSWRVGGAVLKPLDQPAAWLDWQAELLASLDGRSDFRVSVPLQTRAGTWSSSGWTAWRFEPGEQPCRRWIDIIAAGEQLHAALADRPRPALLAERSDRWAIGDRVAWAELSADSIEPAAHLRQLCAALRPIDRRDQLIHGDLTGNVLFQEGLPPLIIDLSPYWRPAAFGTAVVVADALVFEGADRSLAESQLDRADFAQYLLRALIFRVVADRLARPGPSPLRVGDRYGPAVELALELARSD